MYVRVSLRPRTGLQDVYPQLPAHRSGRAGQTEHPGWVEKDDIYSQLPLHSLLRCGHWGGGVPFLPLLRLYETF
jgi:hypothetical protein